MLTDFENLDVLRFLGHSELETLRMQKSFIEYRL